MSDLGAPREEWNRTAFNLLIWLRGGLPERCDFCGQPYGEARYPVPEEAGEWACSECYARWYPANSQEAT